MTRTLRNHTVVGSDHSVTVRSPEFKPGSKVEVIVVLDSDQERTTPPGASFIDAVSGVTMDAPEDSLEVRALSPAKTAFELAEEMGLVGCAIHAPAAGRNHSSHLKGKLRAGRTR